MNHRLGAEHPIQHLATLLYFVCVGATGMNGFHSLDRLMRADALVGRYLGHWAGLESTLGNVIAKGLNLGTLEESIVTKNMQLRDKLKTARVLVNLSFMQKDKKNRYVKAIERIDTMSIERNMVAHDMFGPSEDGDGVEFYIVKAHTKLEIAKTDWTVADFLRKYQEIQDTREILIEIERDLRTLSYDAFRRAQKQGLSALLIEDGNHRYDSLPILDYLLQASEKQPNDGDSAQVD